MRVQSMRLPYQAKKLYPFLTMHFCSAVHNPPDPCERTPRHILTRQPCPASLRVPRCSSAFCTSAHVPQWQNQAHLPGLAERLDDARAQHVQHCRLRGWQLPARQPLAQLWLSSGAACHSRTIVMSAITPAFSNVPHACCSSQAGASVLCTPQLSVGVWQLLGRSLTPERCYHSIGS